MSKAKDTVSFVDRVRVVIAFPIVLIGFLVVFVAFVFLLIGGILIKRDIIGESFEFKPNTTEEG